MSVRRDLAIAVTCLIALIVAIAFPRDAWIMNRQVSSLSHQSESDANTLRKWTSLIATRMNGFDKPKKEEFPSVLKAAENEPLLRLCRDFANNYRFEMNTDPGNEKGYWSVIARRSSIWYLPAFPERRDHRWMSYHIIENLRRPEDTQLRLIRQVQADYAMLMDPSIGLGRSRGRINLQDPTVKRFLQRIHNALRIAVMNIERGGDYARYENGWRVERAAMLRVLNSTRPYEGQDRIAEVDRQIEFHDAAALKQLPNMLLPYLNLQGRKDLARVAANLIRNGEPAILMVVGRSMLADLVKPAGASFREPKDHALLRTWAARRDREFKTGDYFARLIAENDLVADVSAPAKRHGPPPDPLRLGSFLIAEFVFLSFGFACLAGLIPLSDRDGIAKMRSHFLAALGWLIAVILLPDIGQAQFGLLAMSHIGLGLAVLSDRPARIGALLLTAASLTAYLLRPGTDEQVSQLLLVGCFGITALLTWVLDEKKRWRFGLLAGWAVTAVCFALAGVGLATLLPAAGWILGLMAERKRGASSAIEIALILSTAAILAAWLLLGNMGALPLTTGMATMLLAAMLVYRTHGRTNLSAMVGCGVVFTIAYVGVVAWSIRFDRTNEGMIAAYLQEAQTIRSAAGL